MSNLNLSPEVKYLPELDGHQVAYCEYGNPNGESIIYLHGGPGSSSKFKHVKGFDLNKYHLITIDQRGCGKSLPAGKIEANTTDLLVDDLERLRTHLNISQWYVGGSSWGATLALVYAERFPNIIKGLLLGSVFLANQSDISWSMGFNPEIKRFFPDIWQIKHDFLNSLAITQDSAESLLEKICSDSPELVRQVTAGVLSWEGNLMNAFENSTIFRPEDIQEPDICSAKIYLHYEANNFFLSPNQILEQISNISDIPAVLVHGRYDLLCPVENSWDLSKKLTNCDIIILPTSNHRLTAEGDVARKMAFNLFLSKHNQ